MQIEATFDKIYKCDVRRDVHANLPVIPYIHGLGKIVVFLAEN